MSLYLYEAVDKRGVIFKDKTDALSREEVALFLERKKLIPLLIEEEGKVVARTSWLSYSIESVTHIDKITLVRNLALMLHSGLSIVEAVQILIADAEKQSVKKILEHALINLEKGQQLSASFAAYKNIFPQVFVGLIRAGEASGHLEVTLDSLAQQMNKDYLLTKKVKSAFAYPIILMVASALVITLLMIFVLPKMSKTFQMSGLELPFATKIVVGASNFMVDHVALIITLLISFVVSLTVFKNLERGRQIISAVLFRIPLAAGLMRKIALVRLARNLGTLLESGIAITDALSLAADTVGNAVYKKKIIGSVSMINKGIQLSDAWRDDKKLFPRLLVSMIAVGEKTGTLEQVLKTFADYYDEEVERTLKDVTTMLEPLLLLVMGLVVGFIAISVLLPIYQLVGKFS